MIFSDHGFFLSTDFCNSSFIPYHLSGFHVKCLLSPRYSYCITIQNNMKALLGIPPLLCVFVLGKSQTRISGTVTTAKGMPQANAKVLLKSSYDVTSNDSTGHFTFISTENNRNVIISSDWKLQWQILLYLSPV